MKIIYRFLLSIAVPVVFLSGLVVVYSFSYRAQQALSSVVTDGSRHEVVRVMAPGWPLAGERITDQEQMRIAAVRAADPAVVSIVISKDLTVLDERFEEFDINGFRIRIPRTRRSASTEQVVGGGTAFFVSDRGLLMTNRHVVSDEDAQYTVLLNDGRQVKAGVLRLDEANDIALLQVDEADTPFLDLAPAGSVQLAQTAIAIGNALGEYRNTVSVGVVSGIGRDVEAVSDEFGNTELLTKLIQTDAAINRGNSGGPLIDLNGDVIGMNTAVAATAQNIGFAIPVEELRRVVMEYEAAVNSGQ